MFVFEQSKTRQVIIMRARAKQNAAPCIVKMTNGSDIIKRNEWYVKRSDHRNVFWDTRIEWNYFGTWRGKLISFISQDKLRQFKISSKKVKTFSCKIDRYPKWQHYHDDVSYHTEEKNASRENRSNALPSPDFKPSS